MAAEAKAPLLQEARRGATPAQTIGNIVVSIVSTRVLGLPYAFSTTGWLARALGVASAGAATFYCMLLLALTTAGGGGGLVHVPIPTDQHTNFSSTRACVDKIR